MSYVADKPIEKVDDDLLGRSDFAKQFGKSICEYDSKDGLVIGLYGKWGSGKTSIINMAISEIPVVEAQKIENEKWYSRVYKRIKKIFTSQKTEEDQCYYPIVIKFSPWNYSDKNNLISLFFYELKNKLGVAKGEKRKEKIGKAISQYSDIIDVLSFIPVAGPAIAPILKTISKSKGAKLMETPSLDEAKENLCNELREFDKKIIVFIDDIDRLTTPQIKDIFQLVKQVGDFPNIIYVLTMDREIVCNALSEYHNIDGDEYLKKIVQVSFEVPEIDKTTVHEILIDRLNDIVHKNKDEEKFENNEYFETVLENCVNTYVNNIRDVNRLLNAFRFKYGALWKETSFVDLLAITTIEIFEPKLYEWIIDNSIYLCGPQSYNDLNKYEKRTYEYYKNEFKQLGLNSESSIRILKSMFPKFARSIHYIGEYSHPDDLQLLRDNRISSVEKFDLYFMFDIDRIKVSREKIYDCLYKYDKNLLISTVKNINSQGNLDYLLRNMESLFDKEHYERFKFVAFTLVNLYGEFVNKVTERNKINNISDSVLKFVLCFIKTIDSECKRYEIIYSILKNSNKSNIGLIADILNQEEMAFGRFGNKTERTDLQFVSLKHLEYLEKIYIDKIKLIAKSENMLNMRVFNIVFYLWEDLDKEGAENYVKKLFNDKVSKLKFICTKAYFFSGSNGYGWDFNLKSYSNYISRENLYNGIKDSVKNHLDEFTKEEQIKLASFVLNYENNNNDFNHVSEGEALQLIEKWKSESNLTK
ncbi:KAP family P-loop NTPase fold protein [Gardnerella vaginalis]|uniref:ATPase n=2 Tax=Gardnerella TaxID=2701 RepID=A0A3E1IWV9_GARVA|nr:P-loop NTPase fold protein [Gardnerella vaginalis]RFD77446.1 ATPase [Gardnerella vaginalis]RFT40915.1 ATPase [Bifidobacteriaceae bacterium N170]